MNNDFFNLGIQKIIELQQAHQNQNNNIGLSPGLNMEQNLTNAILEPLLNPSKVKISGKYIIDSNNNEVALYERIVGCRINPEGITEEIDKEYFYTMDDGSSMSDFVECSCGSIIHKSHLFLCPVCAVTCCLKCGLPSKSTDNRYFCCDWHRILTEGLF